jgi:hypothetical protein
MPGTIATRHIEQCLPVGRRAWNQAIGALTTVGAAAESGERSVDAPPCPLVGVVGFQPEESSLPVPVESVLGFDG